MTKFETSSEIDTVAAHWAARIDRGSLTELDQASLDSWLEGDVRRLGALARAQAILAAISLSASDGQAATISTTDEADISADTATDATVTSILPRLMLRRRLIQAGTVTALAASLGALAFLPLGAEGYSTERGEVRHLSLADGSAVTMNTDSHIRVEFTKGTRHIYLDKGEVLFEVSKDPQRPFLVHAGLAKVQVLGTAFSVRRTGTAPVKVLVREGVVNVAAPEGHKQSVILRANMKAFANASGDITAKKISSHELEQILAWREGKIAFSDTSLRDAAIEFNRYNKIKIQIGGNVIAGRTVTGMFSSTDPQGFAHAAALSLDLKVQEKPGQIVLSAK